MNPRQKTLLAAGWAILEDYATVARQSGIKAVADVGELAWRSAEAIKDVLYQHSSWVTIITEAYEGGVGKGQQARSLGREIENPWAEGMARTAWQKGYEVGRAQPENPLAEHWREQYEWAFHGWEECKKVCDALRDEAAAPEAPATAVVQVPQAVAYLDVGAGGYLDLGSDLTDEQLQELPKGRHMLAIVGTFGVDGYTPAAPEAPAQEIADVWHEGSRSFYRAMLLKKLALDEVFFDPAGSPEAPTPQAPNPELVDLCHAIVDLHKSNGCVLTVQIEQMAELLEEPKKGGAK